MQTVELHSVACVPKSPCDQEVRGLRGSRCGYSSSWAWDQSEVGGQVRGTSPISSGGTLPPPCVPGTLWEDRQGLHPHSALEPAETAFPPPAFSRASACRRSPSYSLTGTQGQCPGLPGPNAACGRVPAETTTTQTPSLRSCRLQAPIRQTFPVCPGPGGWGTRKDEEGLASPSAVPQWTGLPCVKYTQAILLFADLSTVLWSNHTPLPHKTSSKKAPWMNLTHHTRSEPLCSLVVLHLDKYIRVCCGALRNPMPSLYPCPFYQGSGGSGITESFFF